MIKLPQNLVKDLDNTIGIFNYSPEKSYNINNTVISADSEEIKLYQSLTDNNLGNNLSDSLFWKEISLGGGAALPLFFHTWQDHKLTDASFIRADTFSWQDGDIYYTAYNELVNEKALVVEPTTELVNGLLITYYMTSKNYKIVLPDQSNLVEQIYNLTGAAWYYILDEENKRFKLPRKISDELDLQKTYPVVGNGMALGLTDGTNDRGLTSWVNNNTQLLSGLTTSYGENVGTTTGQNTQTSGYLATGITTDPTKSGIVADLSSTKYKEVQNKKYLYFYVGNTKREETEINIGAITEALNGKVDIDGGNYRGSGLEEIISSESNKIKLVSVLPVEPEEGVLYCIPEV